MVVPVRSVQNMRTSTAAIVSRADNSTRSRKAIVYFTVSNNVAYTGYNPAHIVNKL